MLSAEGEGTKAIGNKRSSQETPAGPSGHPGNSVKAGAPDPEAPRKELLRFWAKGSGKAAGGTLGLVSSTHEGRLLSAATRLVLHAIIHSKVTALQCIYIRFIRLLIACV